MKGHTSSNGDNNFGIYGRADSGNNNYAVYVEVEEGTSNWAGYFLGNGFFSGNLGIGAEPPSAKLDVDGQIKIRGGSPGEGKVLISDATGLASWQTLTGGGLTLPFSGGSSCEECEVFYILNTERGTAIKGDSYLGDGIVGVTRGTGSYKGVLGYATNSSGVSRGVMGKTDSPTGYSGYFEGGRFYVSGNVGIGNTSPANALSVNGQADISGGLVVGGTTLAGRLLVANADGAGNSFKVGSTAGDNANLYFLTDGLIFDCYRSSDGRRQPILLQPNGGRVAIGTKTPTEALDVNGNARFRSIGSGTSAGAVHRTSDGTLTTSTSDIRLKENIETLETCLEKVLRLRGVSFTWKSDPDMETRIGFIAQEFEKVIPELVFTNEVDGYKGINYAEVTAILTEAIKELKVENDRLKAENEKLKIKDLQVESRLDRLEQLVGESAYK